MLCRNIGLCIVFECVWVGGGIQDQCTIRVVVAI